MARVLVTGATGFIGCHFVRHLVERGDQVRCLVRNLDQRRSQPGRGPLPPAVECVLGDITLREYLDEAVAGIETVYHLAGATLAIRPNTFRVVNSWGTRCVAEACARCSTPPTFVYASSLAAAGPSAHRPLSESCPPRPVSEYGRSKLGGEQHLRALAGRMPITILRLPCVLGPNEQYMLKLLRLAKRGLILRPGHRNFRLSWIDVADLVEAMVLAAERGRRLKPNAVSDDGTGVYFIAQEQPFTAFELANLLTQLTDSRVYWDICVPALLCWLAAYVNDCRSWLAGRTYWLNSDKIREALAGSWTCDAGKAKHELGFVSRTDLKTTLRSIVCWSRDQGLL
jgi:nucleoside-diphosphate-sugar epimerase